MVLANAYSEAAPSHAQSDVDELPIVEDARFNGKLLAQLNYQYVGTFRHAKEGIYKIRYDAMVSPDRLIVAMVEGGTLMGIAVTNVSLYSLGEPRSGGKPKGLRTITNDQAMEVDFSGNLETLVVQQESADDAEQFHRKRFHFFEPRPFSEQPMEDLIKHFRHSFQQSVDSGWLRPLADGKARNSLKGALLTVFRQYGFQLGRRLFPHNWRLKRRLKASGIEAT